LWDGWIMLNNIVPLEYRFALFCVGLLVLMKRVDPFIKTFLTVFIGLLILNKWLIMIATNYFVKLIVFVLVPATLSLHCLIIPANTNRLCNVLLYMAVAPAGIFLEWKFALMSGNIIGIVARPGLYALWMAWMYFVNTDLMVRNLRSLIGRVSFSSLKRPLIVDKVLLRFRDVVSIDSIALSVITGKSDSSLLGKLIALVRSTPLIGLIGALVVACLLILYWLHKTASSLFVIGLWPWWSIDTIKICLYDRKEEFKSQLAFSVMFVSIELFILNSTGGFIAFVLNIFHLPIIVLLKTMPLVLFQIMTRVLAVVSYVLLSPIRNKKKVDPPVQDDNETGKRKSIVTKRRSVGKD